jgi:hypothetical protein
MNQLELPMPITGLPADLRSLAAEIHADNIRAGWWKQHVEQDEGGCTVAVTTIPRNAGELLALIHSEISEADEGYRGKLNDDELPHRDMVEVELADTAIRVLDMLGYYGDQWAANEQDAGGRRWVPLPLPQTVVWHDWCCLMHRMTTVALEGFRKGDTGRGVTALTGLLAVLHHCALMFQFDLTGAIAEKRQYNASREDHRLEVRAAAGGKAF